MNHFFETISLLSQLATVTGYEKETNLDDWIKAFPILNRAHIDTAGNILIMHHSSSPNAKNILVEAHRDIIGFCVSELLDGGFFRASPCGGISTAILPGTELIVHGKENVRAIATSIPPHLRNKNSSSTKNTNDDEIFFDTGIRSKKKLENLVSIGDPMSFATKPTMLQNGVITAAGLDNLAGVAAVIECIEKVKEIKNNVDFLFSAGEETLSAGVRFATKKRRYDCAIIVDAGFAFAPGLDSTKCINMGNGPAVSFTDTLSVAMSMRIDTIANHHSLSLQRIAEPGGTGTSATAIQTANGGIPSTVISIPVSGMHSPSETVKESDIAQTASLLTAIFNASWGTFGEVIL